MWNHFLPSLPSPNQESYIFLTHTKELYDLVKPGFEWSGTRFFSFKAVSLVGRWTQEQLNVILLLVQMKYVNQRYK